MTYRIRCSMLPGWEDCSRRAAAKQYRGMVENAGFQLRKLKPSVGAAIGTAVHKAAAAVLRGKMQHTPMRETRPADMPNAVNLLDAGLAVDGAMASFSEEIAPGCEWDATTPNTKDARAQVESLVRAYLPVAAIAEPVLVEEPLKAEIGNGWELTGTLDLYSADGAVDDLKTGSVARPYIQQLGGYALLASSNGHPVKAVGATFIKRVRASKPQPAAVRTTFDLEAAQMSAWAAILEIRRDVEKFAESGDPWKLRANPMSMMCSEKYCPAWGTEFCKVHLTPSGGN